MEGSRVAERKGALVRSSRGTVALPVAAPCCVHPGRTGWRRVHARCRRHDRRL